MKMNTMTVDAIMAVMMKKNAAKTVNVVKKVAVVRKAAAAKKVVAAKKTDLPLISIICGIFNIFILPMLIWQHFHGLGF